MKVDFKAQIKQITTKELVSGDSSTRVLLEIDNMDVETANQINTIRNSDLNKARLLNIRIGDINDF